MPSIERTEFPEISLSDALEILELIRTKNIKSVEALAKELGYSPTSHGGLFFYKRAALSKHYGLLEPSKTTVTLTRLGERIAHPLSPTDRLAALSEVVARVPLLKALYESLGADYHQDDFKPALARLTGASPSELEAAARRMEGVYRDSIKYTQGAQPSVGPLDPFEAARRDMPTLQVTRVDSGGRPNATAQASAGSIPTFDRPVRTLHSEDGYFIRVVLDANVIEEAIDVLNALRNRVAHGGSRGNAEGDPSPSG